MRRALAWTPVALVVAVLGTSVAVAAAGPTVPVRGSAGLCLTGPAAVALEDADITMTATAPASIDPAAPTCVRFPITHGRVSLPLEDGGAMLDGGLAFVRDERKVELDGLFGHLGNPRTTAKASVNGTEKQQITFLRYAVDLEHFSVGARRVAAKDVRTVLADDGYAAFDKAFDGSPLRAGEDMFTVGATTVFVLPEPHEVTW
ncbi:hypothetical protein ACFY41_01920 [Streptomyces syringium]|uniref:hypothetical protein n=1 Tax=Streptomyces syringium TaxID=76729 RepID=UPI003696E789